MQATLVIDYDREVRQSHARVWSALSVSHAPARVLLLHSVVIAMVLLRAHDGDPGRISCLLASQQSSTKMMDGHQLYRSTVGRCRAPKRISAESM